MVTPANTPDGQVAADLLEDLLTDAADHANPPAAPEQRTPADFADPEPGQDNDTPSSRLAPLMMAGPSPWSCRFFL